MKTKAMKLLAAFAAMVMLISAIPASVLPASADTFVFGDVDGNTNVDSGDALFVMRLSVGLADLTDELIPIADINGDGSVDSLDALLILQSAIGLIDLGTYTVNFSSSTFKSSTPAVSEYIERVVELCNIERAKTGAAPLELDATLCEIAAVRTLELKVRCDHIRPNGNPWSDVFGDFNYYIVTAGENVAGGFRTPEEVVEAWMNSEGHRKNILEPKFTKIGVGYAFIEDSKFGWYWEQCFAGVSEAVEDEQASKTRLLDKINAARKANGLPALKIDDSLDVVAETRATDITKEFGNKRPDGSDWKALLDEYNIEYYTVSQSYCAGYQNETEVFDYYMDGGSPKFLDPDNKGYTRIGIGHAYVENDAYGHYWVIILTDE